MKYKVVADLSYVSGYLRQCCDILGCAKCWDEPVDE